MDSTESPSPGAIQILAWLETNKNRLLIGGAAAIVVVCVAIVVIQTQAQRQTSAFEDLSEVKIPSGLGAPPLPGAANQYLKVAEENAGTRAAAWALLLAGGSFFSEAKYPEAQSQFERYLKEYPDSPWQSAAHLGIASSLDVQGKTNEAVTKFEEVRKRFAGDAVVDEAKLALGRLYEGQNKNEEAFKLYDEVLKAGMAMQSGLAMEAGARLEDLTKRHPELVKPKTPIIPTNLITQPILMTNPPIVRSTNQAAALSNAMRRLTSGVPLALTNAANRTNAVTNTLLLNQPPVATPPK